MGMKSLVVQIVVESSDHGILSRAPDAVIGAIREVFTWVRTEDAL